MSRRDLSEWLIEERRLRPHTPACGICKGTGRDPIQDDARWTIACRDCRGFGFPSRSA